MTTTIAVLFEDTIMGTRLIAASHDREALIQYAEGHYLHRNMRGLREAGASVEITDLATLRIRDVELIGGPNNVVEQNHIRT